MLGVYGHVGQSIKYSNLYDFFFRALYAKSSQLNCCDLGSERCRAHGAETSVHATNKHLSLKVTHHQLCSFNAVLNGRVIWRERDCFSIISVDNSAIQLKP